MATDRSSSSLSYLFKSVLTAPRPVAEDDDDDDDDDDGNELFLFRPQ